ncbi:hypothetical protein A3A79_01720 [Candidatus Gottesmanbacteria bacterium RIFCSPLOWO2_01_FULL_43_11b]|uniref:Uncharacterized protein n=1 Tax=Candidatus Gottesmanbacteria bacterium RIFCSPLOWO2_01_FULL_43_11b TaxID=1798392 RepID=A0A1F6AGL5_9BACT|nr:MAG: hypothetical protein A3A79_01720 [Candidatus Gottesmanbacteria bacterium RIFCSPLOWO2_01_FULL_43_11b]
MISTLGILAELLLLFFLSKKLIQNIYTLFYLVIRNRPVALSIVTLLLFPGTVIHELSHLFTAEILGVRTGKLILAPESIRGSEIQAGSVAIVKTGPFRRILIGLAPLFWGMGALFVVSYFQNIPYIVAFYLMFSISNSMFPSAIDMKESPGPILVVLIFFSAAYIAGIRLSLSGQPLEIITTLLYSLVQSLGIVLAVNIGLLLIIHVLIVLLGSFQNFKKG